MNLKLNRMSFIKKMCIRDRTRLMEKKKQIGEHIVDHLSERMNEEIVDPVDVYKRQGQYHNFHPEFLLS